MLFDDEFLYVGARMFDAHPDSILTEYTPRDVYNRNHDWFGIFINPYNDGISDFNFRVTSAGVQSDSRYTVDGEDRLETVWYSAGRQVMVKWPFPINLFVSLKTVRPPGG